MATREYNYQYLLAEDSRVATDTVEGYHTIGYWRISGSQYLSNNYTKIGRAIYFFYADINGDENSKFSLVYNTNNNYCYTNSYTIYAVTRNGDEIAVDYGFRDVHGGNNVTAISADNPKDYEYAREHGSFENIYHRVDGSCRLKVTELAAKWVLSNLNGLPSGNSIVYVTSSNGDVYIDLPVINTGVEVLTATNFTDEENPSFTYEAVTPGKALYGCKGSKSYIANNYGTDRVDSVQAALSFDGVTPDIAYRDIPADGGSYTFELTDAEREIIRQKVQGSTTAKIYFLTKVERSIGTEGEANYDSGEIVNSVERNVTVVGCNPSINPTVKDIKLETLALTGDEATFIRYESMAEYAINAVASKYATIVSQSVTCGSKTISNLPNGVIQDVESGTFNFYVLDSRGMAVSGSVFKNLVEYVKPTCYQKLEIALSGETTASVKIAVNGSYYNGSFGAVDNELTLEVRYAESGNEMGEWMPLNGAPTFNGTTYQLEATLSGLNYGKAYVFQCRAIDKLNVVQSSQYTIRLLPVFDWSETDFNFNVPININGDNIKMHDETIIRHNETANNTVLSASGGHIYLRPSGTNSTSGETIIYPDGSVKFGGIVDLSNGFEIDGAPLADYVIERGRASMGSNGTWYWCKWASIPPSNLMEI